MILVLDASVIIKWFNKEKHTDIALKIRDEYSKGLHEIVVPDLLLYEISNALRYGKEFSPKDIQSALGSLFDMDIIITMPSEELLSKAVLIAEKKDITVYDAVYIALSKIINAKLITADNKLKDLENVTMLKDF